MGNVKQVSDPFEPVKEKAPRQVSLTPAEACRKEAPMRQNLKHARKAAGFTQQQMADELGISLVYYQKIEAGHRTGDFYIWDTLEDITGIHQRKLREISDNHPDREESL